MNSIQQTFYHLGCALRHCWRAFIASPLILAALCLVALLLASCKTPTLPPAPPAPVVVTPAPTPAEQAADAAEAERLDAAAAAAKATALVVATYSSQIGMRIYTLPAAGGGNQGATASSLSHHYNDDSRLAIGAFSETYTGERYVGAIDSIGVWNRALQPNEISLLWNNGAGLAYTSLP